MEEKKNNKFILGTIFALIGAFIGTIPWILMYIFANYMILILSVLIAMASYKGYKLSKATIDKKLPYIVGATSIIAITVSTFIIIPLLLLVKEDIPANLGNLKIIYEYGEFKSAIISDYVISLFFTIVGISGIVSNLHKQLKQGVSGEDLKLDISVSNGLNVQPEEMEATKAVFAKYDALTKENAMEKREIIEDLAMQMPENKADEVFNAIKNRGIIKKYKGKYYFNEKAQNSNLERNKKSLIIIVSTAIVFIAIIVLAAVFSSDDNTKKTNTSKSNSDKINAIEQQVNNISSSNNKTDDNKLNEDDYIGNMEDYETEHVIDFAKMKFTPPEELLILTENEIKTYLGEQYLVYEIIAMNLDGTQLIYCFIDEGDDVKDLTAKEYLEDTLKNSKYDKIETVKIAGFEFQKTELTFEEEDGKYIEECYVCKIDNKFLCFDYNYLEGEGSDFKNMISKK